MTEVKSMRGAGDCPEKAAFQASEPGHAARRGDGGEAASGGQHGVGRFEVPEIGVAAGLSAAHGGGEGRVHGDDRGVQAGHVVGDRFGVVRRDGGGGKEVLQQEMAGLSDLVEVDGGPGGRVCRDVGHGGEDAGAGGGLEEDVALADRERRWRRCRQGEVASRTAAGGPGSRSAGCVRVRGWRCAPAWRGRGRGRRRRRGLAGRGRNAAGRARWRPRPLHRLLSRASWRGRNRRPASWFCAGRGRRWGGRRTVPGAWSGLRRRWRRPGCGRAGRRCGRGEGSGRQRERPCRMQACVWSRSGNGAPGRLAARHRRIRERVAFLD